MEVVMAQGGGVWERLVSWWVCLDELGRKEGGYAFSPLKTLALWRQGKMKTLGVRLFFSLGASEEICLCSSAVPHGTVLMAGPGTWWTGHGKFSFSFIHETVIRLYYYYYYFSPDASISNNPHFSKRVEKRIQGRKHSMNFLVIQYICHVSRLCWERERSGG